MCNNGEETKTWWHARRPTSGVATCQSRINFMKFNHQKAAYEDIANSEQNRQKIKGTKASAMSSPCVLTSMMSWGKAIHMAPSSM